MIGKKTLESKPIPAAEVKEILEEFSLKHDLTAEQNFTLEHVRSLNKISLEDTEKLIEELTGFFQEKEEEEKDIIIKTKKFEYTPMSAEEAIMQMNLLGHTFYVFNDAQTEKTCVVYKRKDGNYGLIEPEN